jgi:hypothetical protein
VPITFTPTAAGAATGAVSLTSTNGGLVSVSLSGTGRLSSAAGQAIVISELRFRGAGGAGGAGAASDEFVELYNRSDTPVSIAGFLLRGSNSGGTVTTRATVPSGITIPAKGHYLFTNTVAQARLCWRSPTRPSAPVLQTRRRRDRDARTETSSIRWA